MGHYISIRGWLECPDSQVQKAKEIIASFVKKAEDYGLTEEGAMMYNKGWHIPDSHINWTHYMFYGADIRIQITHYIRDQIKEMTEHLWEKDGEYTDYIEGIFDLEDEEQKVVFTWIIKDGIFKELEQKR